MAAAIDGDFSDASHARKLAGADVVAIVGETQFGEFQRTVASCPA